MCISELHLQTKLNIDKIYKTMSVPVYNRSLAIFKMGKS